MGKKSVLYQLMDMRMNGRRRNKHYLEKYFQKLPTTCFKLSIATS